MFLLLGDAGSLCSHLWSAEEFPSLLLSTKRIHFSIPSLQPRGGCKTHWYVSIFSTLIVSLILNTQRLWMWICFVFFFCSEHSVTGSPKRRPVSGAHPRGACSGRPADRGSHTGCSNGGEVQKVSVACNLLGRSSQLKWSLSILFVIWSVQQV